MAEMLGRLVFREIGVVEEELAVVLGGEGFGDGGAAPAQRLDFGAGQHHAGFDRVLDQVVVARLAVLRREALGRRVSRHDVILISSAGRPWSAPRAPSASTHRKSAPAAGAARPTRGPAGWRHISPGPGWSRRTARH